ncbi:WD repeat-containing protein 62 isoform X3 [Nelusetta ayraudi]|uniref:WD repeat-containing protein 62 isoform X3 n=1 Tax=Nelusetta ayraudi TaxID=303726 RepID=UPI003F716443
MAEGADCGSVIAAKRRQPPGRKSRLSQQKKNPSSRVILEKVLGISTTAGSGLTSDPNTGLVAYPAGCVVVLLHPKKNKQSHIINTSRRPFSALAFSHDGKYLVTGESGHMPCVRVWEVDGGQVAEVQSHKYGVSCVAFSTNSSFIVSVGYQHDMTVSVWDWRKGSIIASNKVSSRVLSVSFSQDNSYFVTAGHRHVKFWYLDASRERRVNSTVPLIGRSGLLGDHKNGVFCGVACGRGGMAGSTYCITTLGLLCLFNTNRQLEAWVSLKTSSASCLVVTDDLIFCGCSDGVVRVFRPSNLQYITTLPRPHRLGVDLAQSAQNGCLSPASPTAHYPDMLALTFDPASKHLTCVYNDHSVYVWDVKDVRNAGKLYSALYHSGSVWSVEVYPELSDASRACLPPSSFFTCSSDNTIRLWHTEPLARHRNFYSNDLQRILYVGENTQHLQGEGEKGEADAKAGIRVLGISPDGQHLAAGDRCGNLRVFSLDFLDELAKIEAHDSEVLCLAFSPFSTGVKLLASASRDRLIHIFNLEKNYSLEQTLNDHSASITAVKFTGESPDVRMVSCGADKSIYFQAAEQTAEGPLFSRSHHVVEKTTLYDMDLDSSKRHVAIACQDRNIRVYNVETGKLKKCLKGSSSDEGALLKVQLDPSGSFIATSCSDKNIAIFDYESGECVATLFGHSEIVTCMRFSQDCRHLITVSGDSCVFVWKLDSQMTSTMRKRRGLRAPAVAKTCSARQQAHIRRETFITVPSAQTPPQIEEEEEEETDLKTPARLDAAEDPPLLETNGKLPMWFRRLQGDSKPTVVIPSDTEPRQARSRWAEQQQLEPPLHFIHSSFSPSLGEGQEAGGAEEEEGEGEGDFHPQSLESLLVGGEEEEEEEDDAEGEVKEVQQKPSEDTFILYPDASSTVVDADRDFDVEGMTDPRQSLSQLEGKGQRVEPVWSTQLSPDSACSEGSAGSLEPPPDADTDSLSQGSSVGSLCMEDDEDRNSLKSHFDNLASSLCEEKFDTDLKNLQPQEEKHFLNPRLSISTRFLSRFQDRIRTWPSRAPPPVSIPTRILEETSVSNASVNSGDSTSNVASAESSQTSSSSSGVKRNRSMSDLRAPCMSSHQSPRRLRRRHTVVVVQCKNSLRDATVRTNIGSTASSAQQRAPWQGYLGTTASSRAKLNLDVAATSTLEEEEEEENLTPTLPSALQPSTDVDPHKTRPDPPQDQASSSQQSFQTPQPRQPLSSDVLATPRPMTSQGTRGKRWSIGSAEETNQNRTLVQSPAITVTSADTPTPCDLTRSATATAAAVTEGVATRVTQTDADRDDPLVGVEPSSDPPGGSAPSSETSLLLQTDSGGGEESVSLLECQQLAEELTQVARRAVCLHQRLSDSPDKRLQMSSVLLEAFNVVHSELQVALQAGGVLADSTPAGTLEHQQTVCLLEKYSERLLQMTQKKLNQDQTAVREVGGIWRSEFV